MSLRNRSEDPEVVKKELIEGHQELDQALQGRMSEFPLVERIRLLAREKEEAVRKVQRARREPWRRI